MTSTGNKAMSNLPTRQDVLGWQEDLERLRGEEAAMKLRHAVEEKEIRDRRAKLEKFVQYGMDLVDMGALPEEKPVSEDEEKPVSEDIGQATTETASEALRRRVRHRHRKPRKGGKTWTATIKRIVVRSGRGMTYREAKDEVRKTHLGKTLERTDKAFYTAISKLSEKGDIVKHHGRLFSPKAYLQFMEDVAAGRAVDEPAPPLPGQESDNEVAINRLLAARPDGATAKEIVDSLLKNPPPDLRNVTKNKNSIYNLLARLREHEKLIKRGERYYLPASKDEAPDSEESSASTVHHGDRSGNPSSSGNGRLVPSVALPDAIPAQPGE